MSTSTDPTPRAHAANAAAVRKEIARQSFCALATSSRNNRPHVVGVLYCAVDGVLYVSTGSASRKARNVRENRRVAVCIPVRKYPLAPPFCVQFSGTAEVLEPQHPDIAALLAGGRLRKILGFGVLEEPDLCFIRITPSRTVSTYGVGIPLRSLLRDPLHASGSTQLT